MSQTMLIDASQPEESRVVVVDGDKIVKYETESINRKPLRGNIYLAKVVRVEPSLQAAFVDYGQKRQGFLAFDEIHPDYFQIPAEDKQLLLEQQQEIMQAEAEKAQMLQDDADENNDNQNNDNNAKSGSEANEQINDEEKTNVAAENNNFHQDAEIAGEITKKIRMRRGKYKIQEVIKKKQIILVQVVREERGNKGAALTTYISIPSRYTVLMPNTLRGSGLSRKISNSKERKKLLQISKSINVPESMGLIIRTAGENHTQAEIQKDCEYLLRTWNNVRELTLNSLAPKVVYQEGDIIKRSIRDEYSKKVNEVVVAGEQAHKEAKQFMKIFMPKSEKKIKKYRHKTPIMIRYGIENQINSIYSPSIGLKSGGYIVIDKTEAVIAVDVNSGSATKERDIESTAFKTNMEAAEEIAAQLRLRDLAGLIVIDFIDMEQRNNNKLVESHLKKSLVADRARIQVGQISQFGLLEMSRQRLRPDVSEDNSVTCNHCNGNGFVNTIPSMALKVLRAIELKASQHPATRIIIETQQDVAYYILNEKKTFLQKIEENSQVKIVMRANNSGYIMDFSLYSEKLPQKVLKNELQKNENITESDNKSTEDTNLTDQSKAKNDRNALPVDKKTEDKLQKPVENAQVKDNKKRTRQKKAVTAKDIVDRRNRKRRNQQTKTVKEQTKPAVKEQTKPAVKEQIKPSDSEHIEHANVETGNPTIV